MTMSKFQRFQCWQSDRIPQVINKEAIAIDRPTFLATHTPFNKIIYRKMPANINSTSEIELLKELRHRSAKDLHTFTVVQGIPGTGKSHLIRWLKEQFSVLNEQEGGNEVVLLIERANNSLRQTLIQILNSGVFEGNEFEVQKRKLEGATQHLSSKGLEETVINNLEVANIEVTVSPHKRLPKSIEQRVSSFLLDEVIREELKRENGPIKRIASFLSGERQGLRDDEPPAFRSDDFEFGLEVRKRLRLPGGYQEAKDLVEKLQVRDDLRQKFAEYLNELLEFTISRTTALTGDDLKRMFNDLRRELRRQKRNLALFIEDITAFTGLDTGLIDILATQHTGEANAQFCRLTSVIGITDNYYFARFPDNMRERITHHLTLNSQSLEGKVSDLLTEEDAIFDMSARYLNAIRLTKEELDAWDSTGARPKNIPNKCERCEYRAICHDAFGYVNIEDSTGGEIHVGLYPFNKTALRQMYENLESSKATKTPRSLTNSVLAYVLSSHGDLIIKGKFPPRRVDVGNDFSSPTILKPLQRQLLERPDISSDQRDQIESLIVFWGDRTLDIRKRKGGIITLGDLPESVFTAFDLPFIADEIGPKVPEPSEQERPTPEPLRPEPPEPSKHPIDLVFQNIENWRMGGALEYYAELADQLADFVKESIDWELHGISLSLVDDRVIQSRFAIEGQTGRNPRYYYLFKRSDDLALAFHALHDLNGDIEQLSPERIGSHLVTLSTWLHQNEEAIISFVREPHSDHPSPIPLRDLLSISALSLACLGGDLNGKGSKFNLLFAAIKSCASNKNWDEAIESATGLRSGEWISLMKRYQIKSNVNGIRRELLQSLNCSQRRSRNVLFIDPSELMDITQSLIDNEWHIERFDLHCEGEIWTQAKEVINSLTKNFNSALGAEKKQIQKLVERLSKVADDHAGNQLGEAINDLLRAFRDAQIAYNNEKYDPPEFDDYDELKKKGIEISKMSNPGLLVPILSGALNFVKGLNEYVDYLENLSDFLEKKRMTWLGEVEAYSRTGDDVNQMIDHVEQLYADIIGYLDKVREEN
jgi:hypothetical protein